MRIENDPGKCGSDFRGPSWILPRQGTRVLKRHLDMRHESQSIQLGSEEHRRT